MLERSPEQTLSANKINGNFVSAAVLTFAAKDNSK